MVNTFTISLKKAGITCLFLWYAISSVAQAQPEWLADDRHKEAYTNCLSLNLSAARSLLIGDSSPESLYIASLADALELLITEDQSKFSKYEASYNQRIEALKKISPATEKSLFSLAELRLQWSFVYLKFGHDFTAAWNVRQAHVLAQECLLKFPASIPIQKTSGLLEIMLGSVPEKYQWILGLLGMKGSVELGLAQLQRVNQYDNPLAFESELLLLLVDGFVLQQTDTAVSGIENFHYLYPENRLVLFLGATLAIKHSASELALNMLEKLKRLPVYDLPVYYADYLLGEVYLHQGNYSRSVNAFKSFITHYKGENYIKDAHYKIGVAYWLNHQSDLALTYFEEATKKGKVSTEADKYATRALADNPMPNMKLAKVRYSTDGGYYDTAIRLLRSIRPEDIPTSRETTEFNYRYARFYHKVNDLEKAKSYYLKTITLTGQESWYFAPNSCLQLGYIYVSENNTAEARTYFTKALSYKKHEYKNSIDSKAKSALAQLKK